MSEPRLTDERLKTWVTDQSAQEHLCLAILCLGPRFFDVKPRRPMGGPDGARDIEAVFANQEKVWGAVGFRKNATDDSKDKRWVQRTQIKDSSGGHRHRSLWIGGQDAFRRAKRREDGSPVLVWHIDFSQSTPPKKQD
jgi:hypothetical protein